MRSSAPVRAWRVVCAALALTGGLTSAALAQQDVEALTKEGYLMPPAEIAEAVLAPRHLNVSLGNPSPDRKYFLRSQSEGMPTLESFARPHYNLGGVFIDYRANRARNLTTRGSAGFDLISWADGKVTEIQVPANATVSNPQWSPDGTRVAFYAHTEEATHIYVADAATGRSRQVTRTPLNAVFVTSFDWTMDGKGIITVLVPDDRGPEPPVGPQPESPHVRVAKPGTNSLRDYPSLLQNPRDRALLEHYTTGQLAIVDMQSRNARKIGAPAMIRSVDMSPGGEYARVTTMQKPFSYIVPVGSFGSKQEIWSLADGSVVQVMNETPLREGAGGGGRGGRGGDDDDQSNQRRNLSWRPDGQGFSFLRSIPAAGRGGNQGNAAAGRGAGGRGGAAAGRGGRGAGGGGQPSRPDRVMQWLAPFDSTSERLVYESPNPITTLRYSEDMRTLFLTESQGNRSIDVAVFLDNANERFVLAERAGGGGGRGGRGGNTDPPDDPPDDDDDQDSDPVGNLMTRGGGGGGGGRGGRGGGGGGGGAVQLSTDRANVFYSGTIPPDTADKESSPRPFIDRVAIRTGERSRLFTGDGEGVTESVSHVLDNDVTKIIVSRQSATVVPDNFLRDLATGQMTKLTNNQDYTPDLTRAQRKTFMAKRVDGLEVRVNVTLPHDWQPGNRLPAMFWFYPREYAGDEAYTRTVNGNSTNNRNRFPNFGAGSITLLVRQGYAVVEPDAPIIGEEGRMNDNYIHDLRNNLAAVIDMLDQEGVIDRHRLGIGGHSYGAFSTVHAMVHTPFFKAGIAGDGNYNRTLTPFAFQSERRSLWEDRDLYVDMSPIFWANNLSGALLMYHGLSDQNVGTNPINGDRLFEALESLGKTAALYEYPYEDHGPATKETRLDMWARWSAWLDKYVKNAGKDTTKVTTNDEAGTR
jgi:dipeptidyl aminopeptidase/acylaminoacyl peptidase